MIYRYFAGILSVFIVLAAAAEKPNVILIITDDKRYGEIAAHQRDVVKALRGEDETWWTSLQPAMDHTIRFVLGGEETPTMLQTWLMRPDGKQHGAYFAQVRLIPK